MENHLQQLLADIARATANVQSPWDENAVAYGPQWKSEEMDRRTAPRKSLELWTGVRKAQLPPDEALTDEEVSQLVKALEELLSACNCHVCFIFVVPDRFRYRAIRARFDQESSFLQWHDNYFELCEPGQEHFTCALGDYCECGRMANYRSMLWYQDERKGDPDPEEEWLEEDHWEEEERAWALSLPYLPEEEEEHDLVGPEDE